MPIRFFLSLAGLFLIGTMAIIAGNAYGSYRSFSALCRFLMTPIIVERKPVRIAFPAFLSLEFSRIKKPFQT
jgi:hypothetical protein